VDEFVNGMAARLQEAHAALYEQALAYRRKRTVSNLTSLAEFREYFGGADAETYSANRGFVHARWSGTRESEALMKDLGITVRCLPFEQTGTGGNCILTGAAAQFDAVFARAY
jgi:prolyl-tRNA synthetase